MKLDFRGTILSVQPRIRLRRSFDQRSHSYLGYALRVRGVIAGDAREFTLGIGAGAQAKHALAIGTEVTGTCEAVADERLETVEFYKVAGLRVLTRSASAESGRAGESGESGPPWHGVPPALETYRARGHRRLDARTYAARCTTCIWGALMPVEMIIDQWNPSVRKFRQETFCYGPKSCALYRAGPTRKVPGRKGMSWEEEDWVDEEATGHRGAEE